MMHDERPHDDAYRTQEPFGKGPDRGQDFWRWAEAAGIPWPEMRKRMREAFREGFRPNDPDWQRFFRRFFEGEMPPMPGANGEGSRRSNVLSLRVDDGTLAAIDNLVEAGMFSTRAESATWLLQAGVAANEELFTRINATVAEIRRLREELQQRMHNATPHASTTATATATMEDAPHDDAPRAGTLPKEDVTSL